MTPRAPVLVHTTLGGVFELVHVVRRLSLQHLPSRAASWGAWGWVDLLARSILRERWYAVQHDPIWPLLVAIDHRAPSALLGDPVSPVIGRAAQGKLPPADARRPLVSAAAAIVPEGGHRLAEQAVTVAIQWLTTRNHGNEPGPLASRLYRPSIAEVTDDAVDPHAAPADAATTERGVGLAAGLPTPSAFGRLVRVRHLDTNEVDVWAIGQADV